LAIFFVISSFLGERQKERGRERERRGREKEREREKETEKGHASRPDPCSNQLLRYNS
jgi:hypothetical protein